MEVKIKKLHPAAKTPTYGSKGAACFDLYSVQSEYISDNYPYATIDTGLSFEVPQGHVMLVFSRSGHGFNHGVRLANCVGVIDSDYRGEVKVKLTADREGKLDIEVGSRIAQAMIIPIQQVSFLEVDELEDCERGANGFGSTGQ